MNANVVSLDAAGAPSPVTYRPEFSGTAREYFGIWIVNVALSIATLGIYSAWAKVRNKQYFYGNTTLAGASFEYTADPVRILKGRLLVVALLALYNLVWTTVPVAGLLLAIAFVPLLPWIVLRALAFNARYSSYRNLNFGFVGEYWEAFKYYVLWTLVVVVSFGIAYPYVDYLRKRFGVCGHRYGKTAFDFRGDVGHFFVVYITVWVVAGAAFGLVAAASGVAGALALAGVADAAEAEPAVLFAGALTVLMSAGFVAVSVAATAAVHTLLTNHVWKSSRLDGVRFDMRLHIGRVIWIQLSNLFAIVASVGLMIPWARVRMAKYRAECFAMISDQPIETFHAGRRDEESATGDEFGQALELDLAL